MSAVQIQKSNPLTWPFLAAFAACCILFWWLQSILLHFWIHRPVAIEPKFFWISGGALVMFAAGYLFPQPRLRSPFLSPALLDRCEAVAYGATLLLAIPAFVVALQYTAYRMTVPSYLEGHGISLVQQAILYVYLFFGLFYIGVVDNPRSDLRKLSLIIFLTITPRLIVALLWRRFFVAQAIVPVICIAIARGWIRVTLGRSIQIGAIALLILFVPALTRGDHVFGIDQDGKPQIISYFGYMNTLKYFQENVGLHCTCPPLLLSLTAKLIPYSRLGICTVDVGGDKGLTATVDRLLTKKYTNDMMKGTGGNYLLELYLTGGMIAVMMGSALFGFTCGWFVDLMSQRSIFAGIWAECLTRALFAPRGTLGYVYEKIPGLLIAAIAIALSSSAIVRLCQRFSVGRHSVKALDILRQTLSHRPECAVNSLGHNASARTDSQQAKRLKPRNAK